MHFLIKLRNEIPVQDLHHGKQLFVCRGMRRPFDIADKVGQYSIPSVPKRVIWVKREETVISVQNELTFFERFFDTCPRLSYPIVHAFTHPRAGLRQDKCVSIPAKKTDPILAKRKV